MLRLHNAQSVNNDTLSVREDAVEALETVSSGPQVFTTVFMDSGAMFNVKESEEEIVNEIGKATSKAQP